MTGIPGEFQQTGRQALIAAVEAGEIETICVKEDLPRLDRNYLQAGFYTEVYFS